MLLDIIEEAARLDIQIEKELGGIMAVVGRLPPKDGKQIFVALHKLSLSRQLRIYVADEGHPGVADAAPFGSAEIEITISPDERNGVQSSIHQRSIKSPGPGDRMLSLLEQKGWDVIRSQIDIGLACFATDRLQEINDAVRALAEPAIATSEPVLVFRKPLQLKRPRAGIPP
jgi:hypothetical protein